MNASTSFADLRRPTLLAFFVMTWWSLIGQPAYRAPVDYPVRLSGTFAELRGDHFHMGIDIKSSTGRTGDPVLSVARGYISRVQVNRGGYGQAVFVTHPMGTTSVYAHLASFDPVLAARVRTEQNRTQSDEVDIRFNESEFPVAQGQLIGTLGNTGHSFGPHLHFELRNTASNVPINPLHRIPVADNVKPTVHRLHLYYIDHEGRVFHRQPLENIQDTLEVPAWRIGLGVEGVDPFNGGRNKNGLYGIDIEVDQALHFRLRFDSLPDPLVDFRSHIDYASLVNDGASIHCCFPRGSKAMHTNHIQQGSGIIPIYGDRYTDVKVSSYDFAGNMITRALTVKRDSLLAKPSGISFQHAVQAQSVDTIVREKMQLRFASSSLFERLYLKIESASLEDSNIVSPVYSLLPKDVPLRDAVEVCITLPDQELDQRTRLYSTREDGILRLHPGLRQGDQYCSSVWELSRYLLYVDTIPPQINFGGRTIASNDVVLHWLVTDNIKNAHLKFDVRLNNAWVLATFDAKSDRLTCRIPKSNFLPSNNQLVLVAKDEVGNTSEHIQSISVN
ncbi:MAG: M23 family metallopeptidase [Saprospiraceae bacterium]|nr:M23 family metallopeptidase [Saprospiraceae bacterium]